MKIAELIIAASKNNADLFYATQFFAGDAFPYFRTGRKKYIMMSDLEIDRARKEAKVDKVLSLTKYIEKAKALKKAPDMLDAIIFALKEKGVRKLIVPRCMPFMPVDYFRKNGFKIEAGTYPFYLERLYKKEFEMKKVLSAQKVVYSAMRLAEDMIRKSVVRKNMLYLNGKVLTSERVKDAIQMHLLEKGFIVPEGTIVACGKDSIDPHCQGLGPLRPHQSIIVDIFPKSLKTYFFGDATRTFCRGKALPELKKMYNVVKKAQIDAIRRSRPGVNGKDIHSGIIEFFEKEGYPTGEKNGRMQGFIHGTGHSIGLEIHEEPFRIGRGDYVLKKGIITSIEPGLYYEKIGGVRIEDLVYITGNGCRILGSYPKRLEIL